MEELSFGGVVRKKWHNIAGPRPDDHTNFPKKVQKKFWTSFFWRCPLSMEQYSFRGLQWRNFPNGGVVPNFLKLY